ncbi:hypothetical protein ACEU2D_08215 [Brevibacillus laterosporus]
MHKKWGAQEKLAVLQEIEKGQIGLAAGAAACSAFSTSNSWRASSVSF